MAGLTFVGPATLSWAWEKLLDLTVSGVRDFAWGSVPWSNIIGIALVLVGAGLLFWPSKAKSLAISAKEDRLAVFYNLHLEAIDFANRVRADRNLDWFHRELAEDRRALATDGLSLLLQFEKAGITTPHFPTQSAEKICAATETYFTQLAPFMRDGHVDEVTKASPIATTHAMAFADHFDATGWFLRGNY